MGNLECCNGDQPNLILPQQGECLVEKLFLLQYQNIHKVLKEVSLPKIQLNKELFTQFKDQGVFLGKENVKIKNGKGIMLYKNQGIYYIGNWNQNQRNGIGAMINDQGSYYVGEWYKNKAHGYGEYYSSDRNWIYKGRWKKGVKEGLGDEYYPDGVVFHGMYKDDLKNGKGKYSFQNVCYFEGQFVDDVAQGQGKQRGQDYQYQGQWKNNDFNGTGKSCYFDQNGSAVQWYIGQFKDGEKDGYGEYRWSDGNIYKGEWLRGEITGRGVFLNKK